MKIKGITIWEQHIEKLILGLAGAVFVGFTAMQFIGEPNAVETAGETFTPGNVDRRLEDQAAQLSGPLSDESPPSPPIPEPKRVSDEFMTKLGSGVSPDDALENVFAAVTPDYSRLAGVDKGKPMVVPVIPQPYNALANQYFDGLAEGVVSDTPGLEEYFPELPHDVVFTSAKATVNMAEVRKRIAAPGDEDTVPIPLSWYQNGVVVLDVKVQRQQLVDGEWSEPEVLDPIPGQFHYRATLDSGDEITANTRDAILSQLNEDPTLKLAIVQPEFYPLKGGNWSPPTAFDEVIDVEEDTLPPEEKRRRQLQRELADKEVRKARIAKLLDDLGGELDDPAETPDAPRGGDGGGDFGSGGGGGLGTRGGKSDQAANEARRRRLTRQLRQLEAQIAELRKELEALGVTTTEKEVEIDPVKLWEADTLDIWAHDITVMPEQTYRYRLRIEVFNPLFARKLNLHPDQHEVADKFTLASDWSEWTSPLQVLPTQRVFVASATAAQQDNRTGPGQASVEIFKFYDGRWWMEKFNVKPGDRIGYVKDARQRADSDAEAPLPIDFSTNWFVLDIMEDYGVTEDRRLRTGMAATVLLQHLNDDTMVVHDPKSDRTDQERLKLQSEVTLAEALSGSS